MAGNVRELENTLEGLSHFDKSILHVDDIKNILDENESPLKEPDSTHQTLQKIKNRKR